MSKEPRATWGGIKKGDAVLAVYGFRFGRERLTSQVVKSVGPKWITVVTLGARTRYDAKTGRGDHGWELHTDATLAEARRRLAAIGALNRASGNYWRGVSTDTLHAMAEWLPKATP